MSESLVCGAGTAPLLIRVTAVVACAVVGTARRLLIDLKRGRDIDAVAMRNAVEAAFGASDAAGAWNWRTAYDACEAATVLSVRRYGAAISAKATSAAATLPLLMSIASLRPSHIRRSDASDCLQQFSTPMGLTYVASQPAAIAFGDVVLEPSGTGLLAVLAELAVACLILNAFAKSRVGVLAKLFPTISATRFDVANINKGLDAGIVPVVVLTPPSFSAAITEGEAA
jgi:hypothetical protein